MLSAYMLRRNTMMSTGPMGNRLPPRPVVDRPSPAARSVPNVSGAQLSGGPGCWVGGDGSIGGDEPVGGEGVVGNGRLGVVGSPAKPVVVEPVCGALGCWSVFCAPPSIMLGGGHHRLSAARNQPAGGSPV